MNSETAPYSHSLMHLARTAGFYESLTDDHKDFLDTLEPLNIEARYPTHKEQVLKGLTNAKCTEILQNTRQVQQWIKTKL